MNTAFKETRVQQDAKLNKFESELREWADCYKDIYGYEILDGTVSANGNATLQDHKNAKLSKGDIGFKFGQVEFYISQKMARKNDYKVIVPSRVYWNLDSIERHVKRKIKENQLDYFIIDANELKEMRNKRGQEFLIYFDENNGLYYLYCMQDILDFKLGEVYLEPEGGKLNLEDKYKSSTFHEKMSKEEGETKRKYILQRTWTNFESVEECMAWLFEHYIRYSLLKYNKQVAFLKATRQREIKVENYKIRIKKFMEDNQERFIYKPVIENGKVIITAKQDVLIKISDTQKDIYNDQVEFHYNLFDPKYLYLRDKFETTKAFMNYIIGKLIPQEMKEEAEQRLELYEVNGESQTKITIVPPSTFKCKNAKRKEAIQCQMQLKVGKLNLLKN